MKWENYLHEKKDYFCAVHGVSHGVDIFKENPTIDILSKENFFVGNNWYS